MMYIAILLVFFSIFLSLYGMLLIFNRDKIIMLQRVEEVKALDEKMSEKMATFSERAIQPIYRIISSILLNFTPKYKINQLNKKLESAGLLKTITVENWLYNKLIITGITSVIIGLLTYLIEPNIVKAVVIVVIFIVFINVIYKFYLSKKISNRKNKIIKDLPFTLDLITVSVEAGLSFDGAIARVINNIQGELSNEFAKTLKEIRMGIDRKIALRNMSDRCNIKELSMLITSLIQADDLGVSLGNVLRIESNQLRERRKQVAREKAMKAPVKMLFPLIIFIFPAIFVIILGPAAIKIFQIFIR